MGASKRGGRWWGVGGQVVHGRRGQWRWARLHAHTATWGRAAGPRHTGQNRAGCQKFPNSGEQSCRWRCKGAVQLLTQRLIAWRQNFKWINRWWKRPQSAKAEMFPRKICKGDILAGWCRVSALDTHHLANPSKFPAGKPVTGFKYSKNIVPHCKRRKSRLH